MIFVTVENKRPSLSDISEYVVPYLAPEWKQLGEKLNIAPNLIDIIEYDRTNDCQTCCREMLAKWLDSNLTACWEDLINAIDNLTIEGMLQ